MTSQTFQSKTRVGTQAIMVQKLIVTLVMALVVSFCQFIVAPQSSNAGSLDFTNSYTAGSPSSVMSISNSPNLEPGLEAFTLEMFVKENNRVSDKRYGPIFWGSDVFGQYGSATPGALTWGLNWDCAGFAVAHSGQSCPYMAGRDNPPADALSQQAYYTLFMDKQWHHIALSKSGAGGTFSFYIDGIRVAYSPTDNDKWWLSGGRLVIGAGFDGSISNVRLVKGQGLYSGPSITVPTSELTLTSQGALADNVQLLLTSRNANCEIKDYSKNNFTITNSGVACSIVTPATAYNLQFDKQGHGTKPADVGNINSIAVGSLPTIANDGYFSFLGWSATAGGSLLTGTYTATEDSTLYAIWQDNTPPPKTVTYDLNFDGAGAAPTQVAIFEGSTFAVAANPVRPGYLFMGWTDNGTNGTVYGGPTPEVRTSYTVGTSNITLTANWDSLAHPIRRIHPQNTAGNTNELWSYWGDSKHTGLDVVPGWCAIAGAGVNPSTWIVRTVVHSKQAESFMFPVGLIVGASTFTLSPDPSITLSTGATQSISLGNAITSTTTSNIACAANRYSISPALPSPLVLDPTTGVISGTPLTAQSSTPYTLTAERWVDPAGDLVDSGGEKIGYSSAVFTLEVKPLPTITYNLGGGSGTLPTQAPVAEGASFTTALSTGLTKAGFTFNKWSDATVDTAAGESYTISTSDVILTATWSVDPQVAIDAAIAETERLAAIAETARLAAIAETERLAAIAETERLAVIAETARLAAIAETARLAAIAETARLAAIAETARLAAETAALAKELARVAAEKKLADAKAAAELKALQEKAAAELAQAEALKAAQLLADTQARVAAELKAAQEKEAEELRIAQELAMAKDKADADLKAAAENKATEDARAAALLATKKIVPQVTLYSISSSLKLSAYDNSYLKKLLSQLKATTKVTCVGYIYAKNTTYAIAKAKAQAQAGSVCNLIKRYKKSLVTSILIYPATKAPKAATGAKWVAVSYRVDGIKG